MEGILHALSDPVRAAIYAELAVAEGASCSNFLLVRDRPIPKSTLSQHFRALREAGLVRSERSGVEMHNSTRWFASGRHGRRLTANTLKFARS